MKDRLRTFRQALSLSQSELAERVDLNQSNWSSYETGRAKMQLPSLLRLYHEFKVSPNWLLLGIGEMFVEQPSDGRLQISEKTLPYLTTRKMQHVTAKSLRIEALEGEIHITIEQ